MGTTRRNFGTVRRLPSGRWQASYVGHDGGRVVAPETYPTRKAAEGWLTMREAERTLGQGEAGRLSQAGTIPLAIYARDYMTRRRVDRPLKATTRALYDDLLRAWVVPYLGERPLAAITPREVVGWQGTLADRTGPTRRAHAYRLLRQIMAQAVQDGLIPASPCRMPGAGTVTSAKEKRALDAADVQAIAGRLSEGRSARWRAMFLLLATSGLRFGEAVALRRSDLTPLPDGGGYVVRVVRRAYWLRESKSWDIDTPKSSAGARTVYVVAQSADALTEHLGTWASPEPGGLVFPTEGGVMVQRRQWQTTLTRAAQKAGVPEFRPHWLRDTAGTAAAQSGATLAETMAMLGHSTTVAAMAYQHAAAPRMRDLAHRMAAAQAADLARVARA